MIRSTPNGAAAPPHMFRTRNWLLIGMVFVVVMLVQDSGAHAMQSLIRRI